MDTSRGPTFPIAKTFPVLMVVGVLFLVKALKITFLSSKIANVWQTSVISAHMWFFDRFGTIYTI